MIPTAADRAPAPGQKAVQVNEQGIASASGNATTTLPASDTGGRAAGSNSQLDFDGQQSKQIHPKQAEQAQAEGASSSGGEGLKPHQA
ncbi:uncharacterized protein JCM6883_004167 [Sporobolomyces salmoneus]|uniref:uncharacterized protein n=1 Tax=Sporobolomyces salmoneus TaxID=183962 RepID=UPI00316BF5AB